MTLGQGLYPLRPVELGPLRTQCRNGVALAPNLPAQLGDALCLPGRIELDLVDIGRRQHERSNDQHMHDTPAHGRPRITSARRGNCGTTRSAPPSRAGARVRAAARSFADRARGLPATSALSGTSGRLVRISNVGAIGAASGAWREPETCRARAARKVLTMRSSSEWKAITTSRPPA